MCGIAGLLRRSERPLPHPQTLRRMVAALGHRGPDDAGEFLHDDVQLGMVRLAVVDLKNGQQPLLGCDDRTACVFNGEIYNHHDLRRELRVDHHRLANESDGVVIPHLYENHDSAMLEKLRGMFALAVWDARNRRLLLARDRLGIKPLYWAVTRDFFLFASEVKALFASELIDRALDPQGIDDLFSLSYPCPPRSLFRGVQQLLPAHWLSVRAGEAELDIQRYWRAPFVPKGEHRRISRRDAEEEFRELLRRKVYDHLQADVPVATYLSGGLDSSTIAALVKDVTGDPPTALTIGFASEQHDEREFAKLAADSLGCPSHTVVCDETTPHHFPTALWHTELPLQFPLALPLSLLASRARAEGFPVVLTGEGADELLGGYDCFRADKMRRLFNRPGLRSLRARAYRQLYKWHGFPEGTVELMLSNQARPEGEIEDAFGGVFPPWFDVWSTFAYGFDRNLLLSADGRDVRAIDQAPEGFSALVRDDHRSLHPLDAGLALEIETRLPAWILLIGDRASMAAGVEARVPFLDHEIVEFLAPLHPSLKMKGFSDKSLLRGAMKGILPEKLRRRPKRPFYTPLAEWFFQDGAPEYVDDALGEAALRRAGVFAPEVVKRMREEIRSVPTHTLRRVQLEWNLVLVLGTQLIHEMFISDFRPTGPPAGAAASIVSV